jgi:hypothetical protein
MRATSLTADSRRRDLVIPCDHLYRDTGVMTLLDRFDGFWTGRVDRRAICG